MKTLLISIVLLLTGIGGPQLLRAQTPAMPDEKHPAQPRRRGGGVFTLHALDPLSRNLCFTDGKEGMAFVNNQWENRCSDLSYSLAGNGSLVSGIELNRVAAIVDLGTANDLRQRYGYDDAENGGVGFAALRLEGDKIMILEDNSNPAKLTWQPLREAAKLFSEVRSSANAPIQLGHIYVLRIADTKDRNFQQIVKLMVIAYRSDEAVTLRWELL
ncbi:MAG TPA: hypothetical protein VEV42_16875 [Pyrinomonadaceae bacterium]|nr:hypothetical protein [Pyrinomonadaceae bacterium]